MPRLKRVVDGKGEFYGLRFECPGCGDTHVLPVVPGHGACWEWNGDMERPVFSPSLMVRSGHYAQGMETPNPAGCWCNFAERFPNEEREPRCWCYRCHSFIGCNGAQPGQIIFLGDCTHANAGKVMDLPERDDG